MSTVVNKSVLQIVSHRFQYPQCPPLVRPHVTSYKCAGKVRESHSAPPNSGSILRPQEPTKSIVDKDGKLLEQYRRPFMIPDAAVKAESVRRIRSQSFPLLRTRRPQMAPCGPVRAHETRVAPQPPPQVVFVPKNHRIVPTHNGQRLMLDTQSVPLKVAPDIRQSRPSPLLPKSHLACRCVHCKQFPSVATLVAMYVLATLWRNVCLGACRPAGYGQMRSGSTHFDFTPVGYLSYSTPA